MWCSLFRVGAMWACTSLTVHGVLCMCIAIVIVPLTRWLQWIAAKHTCPVTTWVHLYFSINCSLLILYTVPDTVGTNNSVVAVPNACWLVLPAIICWLWSSTLTCSWMRPRRSVSNSPVCDSGGIIDVSGGCVEPDTATLVDTRIFNTLLGNTPYQSICYWWNFFGADWSANDSMQSTCMYSIPYMF